MDDIAKLVKEFKQEVREKAIDEFADMLRNHCMNRPNECYQNECPFGSDCCNINRIAEQLKGVK